MDIPEQDKLRLRETVFTRSQEAWSQRIAKRPSHRFRNFSKRLLNNAVIIHYQLYLKNLHLFETLYQAKGKNLLAVVDAIRKAVAKGGEPFAAVQSLLSKPAGVDGDEALEVINQH
jgi:Putative aminopeptidase